MRGLLNWLFRLRFGSRLKALAGIPGPKPVYPMGTIGEMIGVDPTDVMADYGKTYGPMTLIWFGGKPAVVLNDPHMIREVLVEKTEDYYKDYPTRALGPVLRKTLFNLNSPELDELRKDHPCTIPGFGPWIKTQFPVVKQVAERHLEQWLNTKGEFEAIDKLQRAFFDVYNAITVSPDFEDGGFDNFYNISEMATFRMKVPQKWLWPPISPRYHRAFNSHYGAYEKAVKKARQNPDPNSNNLLHVFLRHGTRLSDQQLVDFISEFHAGGDISSASAVANTLYHLHENPKVASRLYAELREMSRRKPNFDLEALESVPLLDHVLRESMRMIPPVAVFSRNVRKDRPTTLGGKTIPPDTEVMVVMKHIQRSPDHWTNPDTFDPDRWANGGVERDPIGSDYYFPFGRGPRMCAGVEVAMFCMKIILATALSRASVKTSGSNRIVYHCGVNEAKHLQASFTPHAA